MEKLIGSTILISMGVILGMIFASIFMVKMVQINTDPNPNAMQGVIVE